MKIQLPPNIEEKLLEIGIELNKIDSLARILLECIRNDENLKFYDAENLLSVLAQNINNTKEKFNSLELEIGI